LPKKKKKNNRVLYPCSISQTHLRHQFYLHATRREIYLQQMGLQYARENIINQTPTATSRAIDSDKEIFANGALLSFPVMRHEYNRRELIERPSLYFHQKFYIVSLKSCDLGIGRCRRFY